MTENMLIGCLLGMLWGILWALFLEVVDLGRFIAARRAWLAVVVGVGGDLLILLIVLPLDLWLAACFVVAASAIGIIGRSLAHEWRDHREVMESIDGDPDPAAE